MYNFMMSLIKLSDICRENFIESYSSFSDFIRGRIYKLKHSNEVLFTSF